MAERPLNILVIEDDEDDYMLLLRKLSKDGFVVDAIRVDSAVEIYTATP